MNNYEGMFLLNSVEAKRDWDAATEAVRAILAKHGAEASTGYKWDDRRLAYEIGRQKRGAYYLVYFKAEAEAVADILRDCNLSDVILRQLILRWDKEIPAMPTDEELAKHHADLAAISQRTYSR